MTYSSKTHWSKIGLAVLVLVCASAALAATPCEQLSSLQLPNTTITAAQSVAAGAFTQPAPAGKGKGKGGDANPFADLAAFCRVAMTIKPSSDSDIKVELWMPAANWNNKYEANGNGGWAGSITPATLATGLRLGYASSMTDTGHEGGSASFGLDHPEKVIDFGSRAVHEMVLKSKAIITAFYGQAPKLSYWNGCSGGGRQGLMEAQRFPEDFDGIVAGSPALNTTGRSAQAVWIAQETHKDEAHAIPQAKFAAIHAAALAACDAGDGVTDGVLENPKKCNFDPSVMLCKGAEDNNCLTAAQIESAKKIYSDVTNPRTKQVYFQRHEPGSEMGWNTMAGPNPFVLGTDMFKYIVFSNSNWDYKTMNFDSDMEKALKAGAPIDARNPDLKKFFDRGGKLVQYHGWADPQISPGSSTDYYDTVLKTMGGASKVQPNYRLFMVPGMAHCGGGDGTSTFDMLKVLEQWVEEKKTPEQVVASRVRDGKTDRTRPLCPYPQVAVYKGSGSTDEAANFACRAQ
jgi:feruloyl esterase